MKRDPSLIRLSRDHQRGLALAKRIEDVLAGGGEVPVTQLEQETLDMWRDGLVPHFRAECECLLARLARQLGVDHELITRTQGDHLQAHALITGLREAQGEADRRDHLTRLAALLRDHIRWEEASLFEAAQQLLGTPDLERLGDDLAQRLPEIPAVPPWYRASNKQTRGDKG
jgi:hemerythrin-like domain-containing protein